MGSGVIDTHEHLWDLSQLKLNWVTPDNPLNRSYTPKDYALDAIMADMVRVVERAVERRNASPQSRRPLLRRPRAAR